MATPVMWKRRLTPSIALSLAIFGAVAMVYYHQAILIPRSLAISSDRGFRGGYSFGNDFYPVWLSSRELWRLKQDPYSSKMTQEIQIGTYGRVLDPARPADRVDAKAFVNPAYTDLLFWPSSQLSFIVARAVFLALLVALTAASIPFWLAAIGWHPPSRWIAVILVLTLSSYPALEGLFAEQLGLMVAFLLAAGLSAWQQEKFFFSGFLLALTTIKPQVTALCIAYLVLCAAQNWAKRKFFIGGFIATETVLLACSLAVLPNWVACWIRTVAAYRRYTAPPLLAQVIAELFPKDIVESVTLVLTLTAISISLFLAWRNTKFDSQSTTSVFWLTLSVLLCVTTIVLLPGQAIYDHLILIPALLVVVRHRHQLLHSTLAARLLYSVGAVVFFWPWMIAAVLLLTRPFLSEPTFNSSSMMALPIRTAASLPIAVLALLAWIWRITRFGQTAIV